MTKYFDLTLDEQLKENATICVSCTNKDEWKNHCKDRKKDYYHNNKFDLNLVGTCEDYKENWIYIIKYGKWIIPQES